MKLYLVIAMAGLSTLIGCGGSSDDATTTQGNGNVFYIQSESELPTCDSSRLSQLWYVAETTTFKSCGASGWSTVSVGNSIVSNRLLPSIATNLCTTYAATDTCVFRGGQIIEFSDGSVTIMGVFQFFSFDGSVDTNLDFNSVTATYPASVDAGYLLLAPLVARPGSSGFKNLYLVWDRAETDLFLIHDTNGNEIPDVSDTLVETVTPTDWP
jgi:hypothetical protein